MILPGLRLETFFPPEEYERRHRAVRSVMQERSLDVLLCTTPENVFYLTGYQTFAYSAYQALVFPLEGEPFLVLRYLESLLAERYSVVREVIAWEDEQDPVAVTIDALRGRCLAELRIGYEERTSLQPVTVWRKLVSALPQLGDASGTVERARAVKSAPGLAFMGE
ncbi:MAG: aminopeptidase P family N-terminal domain-containing protein, partial [Acetobacteraceae bacterium]|nr:aminopeptidase P family N-terminal domain-containing protein [Acetobacteraceae bacterium]